LQEKLHSMTPPLGFQHKLLLKTHARIVYLGTTRSVEIFLRTGGVLNLSINSFRFYTFDKSKIYIPIYAFTKAMFNLTSLSQAQLKSPVKTSLTAYITCTAR